MREEPEGDVIRGRVPLSGRGYEFTMAELRVMHRRMHLSLRASACEHYGEDMELRGYNSRVIWKALMAVHKGCVNSRVPVGVMSRVYEAARTSYRVAVGLGRSEEAARRQALVSAQIPLEKHLSIIPETDYGDVMEENEFGIVSRWVGNRFGNA